MSTTITLYRASGGTVAATAESLTVDEALACYDDRSLQASDFHKLSPEVQRAIVDRVNRNLAVARQFWRMRGDKRVVITAKAVM